MDNTDVQKIIAALDEINQSIQEAIRSLRPIGSPNPRTTPTRPYIAGQWPQRDGDKFPRGT